MPFKYGKVPVKSKIRANIVSVIKHSLRFQKSTTCPPLVFHRLIPLANDMAESKSDELVQGEVSNELIVGHGPGLIHRFVNFAFNVSS